MGKVYVKKGSGPAGMVGDFVQSLIGGSKQDVIDAAAKRQLANFDYGRGTIWQNLPGDKDAGSLGPKDRYGNQQWIPANAAGRHDMDMEGKLATAAARGIPYARLLSLGLGGLSAIDSLAEAQPGQSALGMMHNAATRGYLSHLGAKSFLDPAAASLASRHGRKALERTNPYNLVGAVHGPPRDPTPSPAPATVASPVPAYGPEDVEVSPRQPYTHGMIPNIATPESHTIAPDMRELIENRAIDGTGVMEQQQTMSPALGNQYAYLQEEYPFGVDTTDVPPPSGNQAGAPPPGAPPPGVDEHSEEAQEFLRDHYGG